jgi:GDPmannose 4,6-dehydratase
MKKALITGITGQDGAYLTEFLLDKGYEVYGLYRRSSTPNFWRLDALGVTQKVKLVEGDLLDQTSLIKAVEKSEPDEVYNLAAQSFVASSWKEPLYTSEVTGLGVLKVLEAIKNVNPKIKFYQASSSEMFGEVQEIPQKETTPFYPRSPYGVAKVFGYWTTVNYRESYNMFTCNGILFNHESPLRGEEFVTRKVTKGIAEIKKGLRDYIELGNLDSKRDWGYAGDYVEAMWLMLQQGKPDDYVIATGETHTVREFVELAFKEAGIDIVWKGIGLAEVGYDKNSGKTLVKVSEQFYRPAEVEILIGDPSKAKKTLGWQPKVSFRGLIKLMVEADLVIA